MLCIGVAVAVGSAVWGAGLAGGHCDWFYIFVCGRVVRGAVCVRALRPVAVSLYSFLLPSVGLSSVAYDERFSYGVQSYIIFGEDNVWGGRELRIINGFNKFDDIERLNDGKMEILGAGAALCDL